MLSIAQLGEIDIIAESIYQSESQKIIGIFHRQCPIEIFLDDEGHRSVEFGLLQSLRIICYIFFGHLQGGMIGDDVPDFPGAEIETDIGMIIGRILVSDEIIPSMRIDSSRDIFEASIGAYESHIVLERDQRLFLVLSFEIIVDIYADLDQLDSPQIEEDKLSLDG